MSCPYFKDHYFGFCTRSGSPYVPSIAEMEEHCFTESFSSCPVFEAHAVQDDGTKGKNENNWLHDIYSDPLIILKAETKTKSQ